MPETTTGQNTTGSFYIQINTGRGFTEVNLSESGTFSQPTNALYNPKTPGGYHDYADLFGYNYSSQVTNQATGQNLYISGNYEFGISKYRKTYRLWDPFNSAVSSGLVTNVAEIKPGSDEIIISKGAYATGLENYVDRYFSYGSNRPYTIDKRASICYDDRSNFIVNACNSNYDSSSSKSNNFIAKHPIDANSNSILGGQCHLITGYITSTIAGGSCNKISRESNQGNQQLNSRSSSILGGEANTICANGSYNTVLGGAINRIQGGNFNTIWNGQNHVLCNTTNTTVGGGSYNYVSSVNNTFVNGYNNNICDGGDNAIFGYSNQVQGGYNNVVFGNDNWICSQYGHFHNTILNGYYHSVYGALNSILGGSTNQIGAGPNDIVGEEQQNYSLIGNGEGNFIQGSSSTIVNGRCNRIGGHTNFIGGGYFNKIDTTATDLYWYPEEIYGLGDQLPLGNFIGHGYYNEILDCSRSSAIFAGKANTIRDSHCSFIAGGHLNYISGAPNSFVIGNRGLIEGLRSGERLEKITGVGIISDGYTQTWNWDSNTLLVSFKHGMILDPGIKIRSHLFTPKEGIETVSGDARYNGYTGVAYPFTYEKALKIINIGIDNGAWDYTDVSGMVTGAGGSQRYARAYNPSIIMGHVNSGYGHSNLILGIGNFHYAESYESAYYGALKWTGVYGSTITGGFRPVTGVKTINGGPWTYSSESWPMYQGGNILIGAFNAVTGNRNMVLGINNNASGISDGSLLLGSYNTIVTPDTTYLYDPIDSSITGINYGTGRYPHVKQPISIGFGNVNLGGSFATTIGHAIFAKTAMGTVIGRRIWATGDRLVVLGNELSTRGYRSANIGYGNLIQGDSGAYNNIFGYNNIIDKVKNPDPADPTKGDIFNSLLLGNLNYSRSQNSTLIGMSNSIDTFSGFSGNYTHYGLAVGAHNQTYGSYNGLFGIYNRSTGLNNYLIGYGNNTQGLETTTIGHTNNNYGQKSVILGSTSHAYGINNAIIGNFGYAVNSNQITLAGGESLTSWPGSSQKNYFFWKGITSGVQRSELMLDGVNSVNGDYISGKAFIHSGMIWNGTLNIIAAETGLGNILTQQRYVTIANRNGSVHVVGNQLLNSTTSGTANWGISLSGDNINKAICINATGEASKYIYWNIIGEFNQTFIPTNETLYRKDYANNAVNSNILKSGYDLWSSVDPSNAPWQLSSKYFFR